MNPVTVFLPRCTCNRQLGALQQSYERELISNGKDVMKALLSLNIHKMCCRISILNCANYFVVCSDHSRITDETNNIGYPYDSVIPNTGEFYRKDGMVTELSRELPSLPIIPGGVINLPGGGAIRNAIVPKGGLAANNDDDESLNFFDAIGGI